MITGMFVCLAVGSIGQGPAVFNDIDDYNRHLTQTIHDSILNPKEIPAPKPHRVGIAIRLAGEQVEQAFPFPAPKVYRSKSREQRARNALADVRRSEQELSKIAIGDKERRRRLLISVATGYHAITLDFSGTKEANAASKALKRLGANEDDRGILHVDENHRQY